jgi:putative endonuclease
LSLGEWGENAATRFLVKNGYKILEKNFRCRIGEIDIIAMDKEVLVFIEVKTRRNLSYGLPSESITATKLHHIRRTIYYYSLIRNLHCTDMRIDVIEILVANGRAYIHQIKNVE